MRKTVSFIAYSLTFLPKVWYVLQFMLIRRLWWIRFWGPVLDRKAVSLGSILVSLLTLPGRPLGSNIVPRGTQMASKSDLDDPMTSFWKTSAVIPWNWSPWHAFLDYIIISVEICSIRPLRCWFLFRFAMPAGQWDLLTWRTFDKFDLGKQKSSLQRVGFSFFAIGRAKLEPNTFRIGQKTQHMRSGSYLVVIFGRSRNQDAEIFKNSIILGSYLEVRINKNSICLASFLR